MSRNLYKKLKARFKPAIEFDISESTLALGLQLGWFEKFMGKYQFTDKGQREFSAYLKEIDNADIRS